jgi:hypothetical protein
LPVVEEIIPIPEDQLCCPECGEAYVPFPKTEDSEIIEIHVAAHVRKIKREQAKAGCHCPNRSGLITPRPLLHESIPKHVMVFPFGYWFYWINFKDIPHQIAFISVLKIRAFHLQRVR